MQISLEWLGDFVEVPPVADLVTRLTQVGIEVECVHDPAARVAGVVVAQVESVEPHPKADKLKVCRIFDGTERHTVVCGAANVAKGQHVALARVGAVLPSLTVTARTLCGVASQGMLASKTELGLEEKSEGIWVLPESAKLGENVCTAMRVSPALQLAITPNRPDLLSHQGIAREVAAAFGVRPKAQTPRVSENGPDATSLARVVVDDPAGCARYTARVVQKVQVGPSPQWLRDRLERIGQRSINNVVDATNYVMFALGQPLHAFDLAKLEAEKGAPTIRVRRARPGETLRTLDGVDRTLDPADLVIADASRAVALAGVMGGGDTEVSATTAVVLIESAHFEPITVRRTARRYGMQTEASYRFERTADIGGVNRASDVCAQLIAEVASGLVAKGRIEVAAKPEPPTDVALRLNRVRQILGIELTAEAIVGLLDPLGIRLLHRNDTTLHFEIPTFRPDVTREIDLIEEVARRYGYDSIAERLPDASSAYRFEQAPEPTDARARHSLLQSGLTEAITFGFGSPSHYAPFVEREGAPLRLLNPLGDELSALRTTLLPGLLTSLGTNQRRGAKSARLFEVGMTFHPRAGRPDEDERDRDLPREDLRVGVVMFGGRYDSRWYESGQQVDFTDLAGAVENLVDAFDPEAALVRTAGPNVGLNPMASAALSVGGTVIGWGGQVHPDLLKEYELAGPVFAAEISLSALASVPRRIAKYAALGKFPGTRRDVAVIADRAMPAERIRNFVEQHAGGDAGSQVVEAVRLFDVYAGESIPKDKVSLAFAIQYRSPERTLTDAEIAPVFEALVKRLQSELGVEVRKLG